MYQQDDEVQRSAVQVNFRYGQSKESVAKICCEALSGTAPDAYESSARKAATMPASCFTPRLSTVCCGPLGRRIAVFFR